MSEMVNFVDVKKAFGSFVIFDGLNLKVAKNSIHCLIGRSGSGKSVLIKHILGFLSPDQGQIYLNQKDISEFKLKDWRQARKKIGILFQDSALFDSMDVFENVAFPIREHTKHKEAEIKEIVFHKLKIVGLARHMYKLPSELSGGMRKRAALARAIAIDPDLVLFDEPSSGLDPIVTSVVDELILKIQAETKATFLVITHDMASTYRIADKVSMLYDGKVVFDGSPEDIKQTDQALVKQFISGGLEGPFNIFY